MKSFTFRVTCRFAALVTATTAAVLVIGGWLLDREIEHGLELLHDIEVHELSELLGSDVNLSARDIAYRIKHDADSDAALFVMQVANAHGTVLFRSDNLGDTLLPGGSGQPQHWTTTLPFHSRVRLSYYLVGPWRIHIGSPLEPSERLLRDYGRICIQLLVGIALVSIALGYAFSRATLAPIRAIAATADRIRGDNLAERIPEPDTRDELSSLTRLLNQTFDRLQASFEQVRRFSADASHELKTPLALVRLNLEKLRPRVDNDAEAAAALDDVLEEVGQLNQVIDRLLFLAKAEGGALPVALRLVQLQELVSTFAEDAQALAEDKAVRFAVTTNEPGERPAEPQLLRQLLLNLVTNAVAVSPPRGLVTLESKPTASGWCLSVTDEGPGVPAADLPRIFERFVQLPPATPTSTPRRGHGLGLAICRSIADLHHGTIVAENRPDRSGLRVTLTLP